MVPGNDSPLLDTLAVIQPFVDALRRNQFTAIREVEVGQVYYSPTRIPFQVLARGKHAQDCTIPMIIFTNLIPTLDQPKGVIWTLEESVFLNIYQEAL